MVAGSGLYGPDFSFSGHFRPADLPLRGNSDLVMLHQSVETVNKFRINVIYRGNLIIVVLLIIELL